MAWSNLTPEQQAMVTEFTRQYRAAMADTVRGLLTQHLLSQQFTLDISAIWANILNTDIIPDSTGLAGADLEMTKAEFNTIFGWTSNVLAAIFSDNGGAVATVWPDRDVVTGYGVQLAGPTNVT